MDKDTKTILIIENDDALRDVIDKKLNSEGFIVLKAKDGKSGLEQMRLNLPDLVITDIFLEEVSGIEVLEKIKEEEHLSPIPVIVLSDIEQSTDMDKMNELGFKDCFIKNEFSLDELLERIKEKIPVNVEVHESNSKNGLEGIKILVVEDDEFFIDILSIKLNAEGSELKYASDGESAIEILKDFKPQILLLDITLPGINGFELLEQVKNDGAMDDVSVIVLSNLLEQEDIKKGLELGVKEFLVKANHSIDEIVLKIKEHAKK